MTSPPTYPVHRVLLAAFFLALTAAVVRADGYPFDEKTQRVMEPSLRLKLTPRQIQEISSTGTLTFGDEQMRFIRMHYPAATDRTDVVAATFNDNHEGLTNEDVYCFWVAPDEVAVTLNEKHPKDRCPFGPPDNHQFPTDAQLKKVASRYIRLSPDGTIYFRGRVITLEQAFAIIDDIARLPKPEREVAENHRCLCVVVPPPLSERERHMQPEERRTPMQILDALSVYGASKSIQVGREW
jgi:hypothetical protein